MSDTTLSHAEKIAWMHKWCAANGVELTLEGECGFGRECVGIVSHGNYPDYEWYVEDEEDDLGQSRTAPDCPYVWAPPNAYHKHPCVAVLGRGEEAEAQLYDWLKWFEANDFTVKVTAAVCDPRIPYEVLVAFGKTHNVRMVKRGS